MKKFLSIMMIVSLACMMLAGCGSAAQGEGPLLAFICKDLSQTWFVGTSTAMRETALARGARDFLLFDCGMSPDEYITALDVVISQGVDILIVCPPDQNLSQITVERCEAAGIRVMADDDGLIDENGVHIAPALELDAYVVGEDQGEWIANYVLGNDIDPVRDEAAFMFITIPEVSSVYPRTEGARDKFLSIVPDWPADKLIEIHYDGTAEQAFNAAAATITANPDVKIWIVATINDEAAQGATRALEQAGKDREATVVGMGGYLAKDEFKKEYSAFKAAAYFSAQLDGEIAANAAMDWWEFDKEPYEEYKKPGARFGVYPFGAIMVDATNYREIMGAEAD